ncbi:MAG TPA: class I SAM-dependent methyltransferase family protein [Candidatus Omnitrophota bacterium]|mgnify:CR=1 FL=1|nr:class I SAM-dependent methyltransferase family protein [Candidatus Omnitrophota bacterium]
MESTESEIGESSSKLRDKVEDFFYKKIIRPLLLTSRFGRQSVLGKADSGVNFEYIYRNKAEGITVFGRLVDRVLLNLPSVKATRNRKDNIVKILKNEIENNYLLGQKTKILDVGCGTSRYLLELQNEYSGDHIEALCLDYDADSIKLAKRLIGVPAQAKSFIRYTRANVMRIEHLKYLGRRLKWTPNVLIASGFIYYLDDEGVRSALREIYRHLDRGGLLVMSSIQSSPSRKLMEKVCTTQKKENWVLNYREPEAVRKMMIGAGFRGVVIGQDPWGMYNVCTGRKPWDES